MEKIMFLRIFTNKSTPKALAKEWLSKEEDKAWKKLGHKN
jgi:hypothetical protein